MSEQNMDLVRRHFQEIWNLRDPSACDELMAADFLENGTAPFETRPPGRVSGPAAMRGTVTWLISQFPDLTYEIEAIVADGDLVVARVRSRGTNRTSCCFHGRFGSAGHRPPRVSIAMAMKASGVWNPLARLVSARRCVFVASESALDRP